MRTIVLALLLTACSSVPSIHIPEEEAKRIVAERITITEVQTKYGQPLTRGSSDGQQTISYAARFGRRSAITMFAFDAEGRATKYHYQEIGY